ncbi:acyltransferase family protein [Ferrimonas lipolytica]|uniref:Acyltransferase n=1 Tax=Ferrimonas lipolytica TaxID=2724191 RepID=A0A6H1UHC3_9GAMM|nr:acyltransferase [Ferrimonas lipolytica]QIZ78444.1 acyltransferase [Ferrimonas lipolytica]
MKKRHSIKHWLVGKLEISHGGHDMLLSMEGLRGIAVFLVFLVHYSSFVEKFTAGISSDILSFVMHFGHLGVDLFFVLSGYLIYGSILKGKVFDPTKYVRKRVKRIYPTFLCVFIIYIILSFIFPSESKIPADTYSAILYLIQNLLLLPGLFDIVPMITVSWSLSYEVFYYAIIPLIVFSLRLKGWQRSSRVAMWLTVSIVGFGLSFISDSHIRLLMFISGILLFEFSTSSLKVYRGGGLCFLIALSLYGFKSIYDINNVIAVMSASYLFIYLCLCSFNKSSTVYKFFTVTWLRWLGNISYSYYLVHSLTLSFSFLILERFISADYSSHHIYYWLWIPLFIFSVIVSFVLYVAVEHRFSLTIRNGHAKKVPVKCASPAK